MTTLHAGSAALALERFFHLANTSAQNEVWDIVVHLENCAGKRSISEIRGA